MDANVIGHIPVITGIENIFLYGEKQKHLDLTAEFKVTAYESMSLNKSENHKKHMFIQNKDRIR
jgi:hypothetical protein